MNCFYCEHVLTHQPLMQKIYDPHGEYMFRKKNPKYLNTKDHVISKSMGGEDCEENIVQCCSLCNQLKGPMLPDEFAEKVSNNFFGEKVSSNYTEVEIQNIVKNCKVAMKLIKSLGHKMFRKVY